MMIYLKRDGTATFLTAAVVGLAAAHFHLANTWPLVGSVRWTIAGMAILAIVAYSVDFFDESPDKREWHALTAVMGVVGLVVAVLGLITASSSYLVAFMLLAVLMWLSTTSWHAFTELPPRNV